MEDKDEHICCNQEMELKGTHEYGLYRECQKCKNQKDITVPNNKNNKEEICDGKSKRIIKGEV